MAKVTLFFDTEFTDLKKDCELISIGVCAYIEGLTDDDGKPSVPVFYAESMDFSEELCSDFVRKNVLPRMLMLKHGPMHEEHVDLHGNKSIAMCGVGDDIGTSLRAWIDHLKRTYSEGEKIEVWSDCLAYDWVLFCDILGDPFPMDTIYYIPFDLATLFLTEDIDPDITREDFAKVSYGDQIANMEKSLENGSKHNSLFDAMIIYFCWKTITQRRRK